MFFRAHTDVVLRKWINARPLSMIAGVNSSVYTDVVPREWIDARPRYMVPRRWISLFPFRTVKIARG